MARRHIDEAIDHLNGHHQKQSAAIIAGRTAMNDIEATDLKAATVTRHIETLTAAIDEIDCAACVAIVTDGIVNTRTPEPDAG